jgi:hypothetical protein
MAVWLARRVLGVLNDPNSSSKLSTVSQTCRALMETRSEVDPSRLHIVPPLVSGTCRQSSRIQQNLRRMNVGIASRSAVPDYATTANLFKPPFQGLQMTARERKAALTWDTHRRRSVRRQSWRSELVGTGKLHHKCSRDSRVVPSSPV